jgi:hypothetical protein
LLNESDTGHWKAWKGFTNKGYWGFVYLIKDKTSGELYIGKKQFRSAGRKTRGTESDWKRYTSSHTLLKQRVKDLGKENFDFVILECYKTRGGWSFAEIWSLVTCEVPNNNSVYLNRMIDKVGYKVTEPITARHKKRIKQFTSK